MGDITKFSNMTIRYYNFVNIEGLIVKVLKHHGPGKWSFHFFSFSFSLYAIRFLARNCVIVLHLTSYTHNTFHGYGSCIFFSPSFGFWSCYVRPAATYEYISQLALFSSVYILINFVVTAAASFKFEAYYHNYNIIPNATRPRTPINASRCPYWQPTTTNTFITRHHSRVA